MIPTEAQIKMAAQAADPTGDFWWMEEAVEKALIAVLTGIEEKVGVRAPNPNQGPDFCEGYWAAQAADLAIVRGQL